MAFDDLLNNTTSEDLEKDRLIKQALKRQEYNRKYQAKLRNVTKLLTLEKRIDANLVYVIGYIKKRYAQEYADYIEPVSKVVVSNPMFDNWVLLSADEYKSIKDAFEVSGLSGHMTLDDFEESFRQYYKQNDKGRYIKH